MFTRTQATTFADTFTVSVAQHNPARRVLRVRTEGAPVLSFFVRRFIDIDTPTVRVGEDVAEVEVGSTQARWFEDEVVKIRKALGLKAQPKAKHPCGHCGKKTARWFTDDLGKVVAACAKCA